MRIILKSRSTSGLYSSNYWVEVLTDWYNQCDVNHRSFADLNTWATNNWNCTLIRQTVENTIEHAGTVFCSHDADFQQIEIDEHSLTLLLLKYPSEI